ncbi:hypothetical protein TSAR_006322, partial [Trichomalopsis sarcophagae]
SRVRSAWAWLVNSSRHRQTMLSDMNHGRTCKTTEIVEEYVSSLQDLKTNSKPQINLLTILAEDYIEYASAIVEAVEAHLQKKNVTHLNKFYFTTMLVARITKIGEYGIKKSSLISTLFMKAMSRLMMYVMGTDTQLTISDLL